MKIQFLPAMRVDFQSKDGPQSDITVYRPYSVLPLDKLEEHAAHDEIGALLELGERYYFGLGVEKDAVKAYPYLVKAADGGAQDAKYMLAECYRTGTAVEQDQEKYLLWLSDAAMGGSWMAMVNLAAAYHNGDGVVPDDAQAFSWTIQAEKAIRAYWDWYERPDFLDFGEIKQRLLSAYLQVAMQLSEHYAQGMGVKRDLKRGIYWLERGKRFAVAATKQQSVPVMDNAITALRKRMQIERNNG